MTDLPKKELLRVDEVAAYFSLSPKTIYGWIDMGKLDAVRIGPFNVLRVPRENVNRMVRGALSS